MQLIKKPGKQILLPVIFYIDGANTGHFVDLPLTAVKFTLGIFTRKAHDKEHLWRTLGYIPSFCKFDSRARRLAKKSLHMESVMIAQNIDEDEGELESKDVAKAQDLHAMLRKILASYISIQGTSFKWDLPYQNTLYPGVEFVLFTPFLKLDSDEAEKLCGKYTSRSKNVKCLCRYCVCPTAMTDKAKAKFPLKTQQHIQALIDQNDDENLKLISQQKIQNCMYDLRFGSHSTQGVHGACPVEMLHALLLGIFRYVRDCFFTQIGETSILSKEINAFAKQYGQIIARQSNRDFPKTNFKNGICKGKLNAKDFPGILLCLAAVLRSSGGRSAIARKKWHFPHKLILMTGSSYLKHCYNGKCG